MTTQTWAIVGTGQISHTVVPDLQRCEGAEITLVYSRDGLKAQEFAAEHGIAASTSDFEAVINDPLIDVIYLAAPISTHVELTRRALTAGKHVLVEKPMATNARDAAALFDTAREHHVFLMEGMWMKFNPAFQHLLQEIRGGRIGEVTAARASYGMPFPKEFASKWDPQRSGGALLDQGIYPLTFAYCALGAHSSVAAAGTLLDNGLDTTEHMTVAFTNGTYAQCSSSMVEFMELTATVSGTRGWITINSPFWNSADLEIHADGWEKIISDPAREHFELEGNGYVPMLRAVIGAIDDGLLEHPLHSADDTIGVFRMIDDVFASLQAATGRGAAAAH
ncbi:Gfo/Idh/MocA family protein [Frankia sp. AgW1.1]|nr:Gfo/Idh/MocA family oxidoreductase [Frankia sp. AgW1.1]